MTTEKRAREKRETSLQKASSAFFRLSTLIREGRLPEEGRVKALRTALEAAEIIRDINAGCHNEGISSPSIQTELVKFRSELLILQYWCRTKESELRH